VASPSIQEHLLHSHPSAATRIQTPKSKRFWILGFGFGLWIFDFGFWILDNGFGVLDFWISDFGFWERFGFCIRLFYYTPTRVGGYEKINENNNEKTMRKYVLISSPWLVKMLLFLSKVLHFVVEFFLVFSSAVAGEGFSERLPWCFSQL